LKEVNDIMTPHMQHTLWPPGNWRMTPACRRWPDSESMVTLYHRWWKLVRRAALTPMGELAKLWNCKVLVRRPCRSVFTLIKGAQAWPWDAINLVSDFVSGTDGPVLAVEVGRDCYAMQHCDVTDGLVVGSLVRVRVREKESEEEAGGATNSKFVTAQVMDVLPDMDQRAAASSLETRRFFSKGCWHCNRLFHRCRRTLGCESIEESWISSLKYLWDPTQGGGAGVLAQRLRLRIAGVRGNGADDAFVDRVVRRLFGESGLPPRHMKESKALRELQKRNLTNMVATGHTWLHEDSEQKAAYSYTGTGEKSREKSLKERAKYEPDELEADDVAFLEKLGFSKERGCLAKMPLYAESEKQWEADLWLASHSNVRAKAWAAEQAERSDAPVRQSGAKGVLNFIN
jgi:hypothetical protein